MTTDIDDRAWREAGAAAGAPPVVDYAEAAPSPALAPWVACFWSLRGTVAAERIDRVLPDGCADIIIDIASGTRPQAVGAMRRALAVPLAGYVDKLGVRFRPGAALMFLDIPLSELTDRVVPLDACWGARADALIDHTVGAAPAARVGLLDALLRARVRRRHPDDELVTRATAMFQAARGGVGVREVAAALGVGERRLERVFDRCVGLSPKQLARVVRFGHAVRRIECGGRGWTDIAFATGYADQAHFIREFRELAGVTPPTFVAERAGVGNVQYPDAAPG